MYSAKPGFPRPFRQKQIPSSANFHAQALHETSCLALAQADTGERFNTDDSLFGIGYRSDQKGTFQTREEGFHRAGRAVVTIFESSGESTFGILLEMIGDSVGVEVENFGNEAMLGTLVVHTDHQKLGLVFLGDGGVVESFGNVRDVLVSEFEADHFGHLWEGKLGDENHLSFSQILMRGGIADSANLETVLFPSLDRPGHFHSI